MDWNNILEELTDQVGSLRGAAPESAPPLNAAVTIYTLDIPDFVEIPHPVFGNVSRIQVIKHSADFSLVTDSDKRSELLKTHILCTFSSGKEKLFYYSEKNLRWWESMIRKFPKYGGTVDDVHSYKGIHKELLRPDDLMERFRKSLKARPGSVPQSPDEIKQAFKTFSEPFEIIKYESIYNENEKKFYPRLRALIPKLLMSALRHHFDDSRLMSDEAPLLVSIGSGSGDDLAAAKRYLEEQGIKPQTLGIEISPELVRKGNERFPDYNIIEGDALQSAALIRDHKGSANAVTLVIAEGLLNRQALLGGTYAALRVLHQLMQDGVADMVVIAGLTNLLVNAETASASGWTAYQVMLPVELEEDKAPFVPDFYLDTEGNYGKYAYIGSNKKTVLVPSLVLIRPDFENQMNALEARSLKRSQSGKFTTLDLSMFGLPLKAIEYFSQNPKLAGITQIDLSWSYLEDNQIDLLIDQLQNYPELVHIAASGFEPWYENMLERVKKLNKYKFIKRLDSQYPEELPSLSPHLARQIKQYGNMPNTRIFTPTGHKVRFELDNPPEPAQWQQDAGVSELNDLEQQGYTKNLLSLLNNAKLKLLPTRGDGSCLYHALAMQMETGDGYDLRQQLSSYLTSNEETFVRNNPVFSGDQFSLLLEEVRSQNAWGDIRIALAVAQMSGRRVIVVYPQTQGSEVRTMVFSPGGQGIDSLPEDISSQDIFLVHNGQGHWLAAIYGESDELQAVNEEVLSGASGMQVSNDGSLLTLTGLFLLKINTNSDL
ncbi:hypothetical protein [Endozoicomonas lisbonensis]|uniref:hypothetical protein n=1 Tax=Endozoicomonas lisbonensis TaxID=3120522 RepID=UPI00339AADEF